MDTAPGITVAGSISKNKNPLNRNRTGDHSISANIYSRTLYQLSYEWFWKSSNPKSVTHNVTTLYTNNHHPSRSSRRCTHRSLLSRGLGHRLRYICPRLTRIALAFWLTLVQSQELCTSLSHHSSIHVLHTDL